MPEEHLYLYATRRTDPDPTSLDTFVPKYAIVHRLSVGLTAARTLALAEDPTHALNMVTALSDALQLEFFTFPGVLDALPPETRARAERDMAASKQVYGPDPAVPTNAHSASVRSVVRFLDGIKRARKDLNK